MPGFFYNQLLSTRWFLVFATVLTMAGILALGFLIEELNKNTSVTIPEIDCQKPEFLSTKLCVERKIDIERKWESLGALKKKKAKGEKYAPFSLNESPQNKKKKTPKKVDSIVKEP